MNKHIDKKNKYIFLFYALANIALAMQLGKDATKLSLLMMAVNIILGIDWTFKCFGFKRSILFIAISFAVAFGLETLSMKTGYPYGHFRHNLDTVMVGSVPLVACFMYFPLIAIGWVYGDMIVKSVPVTKSSETILRILIASLVTATIDLLVDPILTLVFRFWDYPNGGGIFGVPMTNIVGWMANTVLTLTIFELISNKNWKRPQDRIECLYGPVCYLMLAQAIPLFVARFTLENRIVADVTGKGWNLLDIYDCLSAFALVVLGLLFVLGTIGHETYEKRMKKAAR